MYFNIPLYFQVYESTSGNGFFKSQVLLNCYYFVTCHCAVADDKDNFYFRSYFSVLSWDAADTIASDHTELGSWFCNKKSFFLFRVIEYYAWLKILSSWLTSAKLLLLYEQKCQNWYSVRLVPFRPWLRLGEQKDAGSILRNVSRSVLGRFPWNVVKLLIFGGDYKQNIG